MTRLFHIALSLGCTLFCVTTHAQTSDPTDLQRSTCPPVYQPVHPPVYGPWGHASTFEEGYLNGQANLLRGKAAYNLATSQALANREVARQLAIQNKQESLRAYYEAKDMNTAYRQARRQPVAQRPATQPAAKPVTRQVTIETRNPQTGALAWPQVLQTKKFEQQRRQVEQLVNAGDSQHRDEIRSLADAMRQQLKQHIRDLAPMDYVAAGKFLAALPDAVPAHAANIALAATL
ncbi:MAG: hypothetical protein NTY19_30680 [Planctomycetota bacterium]|nr:hypothetical protein [Planctomycetota bacterium]